MVDKIQTMGRDPYGRLSIWLLLVAVFGGACSGREDRVSATVEEFAAMHFLISAGYSPRALGPVSVARSAPFVHFYMPSGKQVVVETYVFRRDLSVRHAWIEKGVVKAGMPLAKALLEQRAIVLSGLVSATVSPSTTWLYTASFEGAAGPASAKVADFRVQGRTLEGQKAFARLKLEACTGRMLYLSVDGDRIPGWLP